MGDHRLWMMWKLGIVAISINRMVGLLSTGASSSQLKILVRKSSEEVGARAAHSIDIGRYEAQASVVSCTSLVFFFLWPFKSVSWTFAMVWIAVSGSFWGNIEEFRPPWIHPSSSTGYDNPRNEHPIATNSSSKCLKSNHIYLYWRLITFSVHLVE